MFLKLCFLSFIFRKIKENCIVKTKCRAFHEFSNYETNIGQHRLISDDIDRNYRCSSVSGDIEQYRPDIAVLPGTCTHLFCLHS